jgi:hypothetical protein
VKPPGKVPLVAGLVCLGLWVVLAFQGSAAYDSSCVRGTLRCRAGVSAVYTASGLCFVAGAVLLAWAFVQRVRYRRYLKRQS